MQGDDNVIYGSFGASGIGDVPPIASATSETQPPVAGGDEPQLSPADLQTQLGQLSSMLAEDAARLAHPSLEPEVASRLLARLAELQALTHGVAGKLGESVESSEGYISVKNDLDTLGGQVVDFHEEVGKLLGEPASIQTQPGVPGVPVAASVTWTAEGATQRQDFVDPNEATAFAQDLQAQGASDVQLHHAQKPFPWGWLAIGLLAAGGVAMLASNSKKAGRGRSLSGPGRQLRDARPAL